MQVDRPSMKVWDEESVKDTVRRIFLACGVFLTSLIFLVVGVKTHGIVPH